MTRRCRGLTLVEMMLSIALLSVVIVGAVTWTAIAAHLGVELTEPARWEGEARLALRLVADDLQCGDAPSRRTPEPRVELRGPDLLVRTRNTVGDARGPVEHRYHLDAVRGQLTLEERTAGRMGRERVLLPAVARFDCRIDEERNELEVVIAHAAGPRVERRYRLP